MKTKVKIYIALITDGKAVYKFNKTEMIPTGLSDCEVCDLLDSKFADQWFIWSYSKDLTL